MVLFPRFMQFLKSYYEKKLPNVFPLINCINDPVFSNIFSEF